MTMKIGKKSSFGMSLLWGANNKFGFNEGVIFFNQISTETVSGDTFLSINTNNDTWDRIVTLKNGEFEIQKLVLDNGGNVEVQLTDPNSDDQFHAADDVWYWVLDEYDTVYINDGFEDIDLRVDYTFGFNSGNFSNQFSSTYDNTNNQTLISISGDSIQNNDLIVIDGEYGVVSFPWSLKICRDKILGS